MDILIDTFKNTGNLHHAYSIEGNHDEVKKDLADFLEKKLKLETQGNPDVSFETYETFTIDDGRRLAEREKNRSFSGGKKIFVMAISGITHEAQNSLLKVFEEPTPDTHFFLIIGSQNVLIPTVRSRLIHIVHSGKKADHTDAEKFIKMAPKKRLEFVQGLIDEKDKAGTQDFLSSLEKVLSEVKPLQALSTGEIDVLQEISRLKGYLSDRSPSLKQILEYIALVV